MNPEKPFHPEEREQEEALVEIGRITLLRHGQTEYTNVYPDLTEEGQETIRKSAEQIATNLKDDEELVIVASDKARAQGTASIIKEVLMHDKEVRSIPGITSMAARDPVRAMETINEYLAKGEGIKAVDLAYTHDPHFDDAEVWEPRSDIQKRFFTNLEYTIRAFKRVSKHKELPRPHLIAVSHFEVLNPFVAQIFDLKHPDQPTLSNGELIEISVLDPSKENENLDIVQLNVSFRGENKTVGFDRKNRQLLL